MWIYYIRKNKQYIFLGLVLLFMIIVACVGISINRNRKSAVEEELYTGKTMGTAVKKTLYMNGKEERDKVNVLIDQTLRALDNQISVRITDSEVSVLNRTYKKNGAYVLSPNIIEYLKLEMQIADETEGAFSPCIYPLTSLWKIEDTESETHEIPSEENIEKQMKSIDRSKMAVSDVGIVFSLDTMAIDFGAAGKGIACDEVYKVLKDSSVDSAIVSVGGSSVVTYGEKTDGKPWNVGIRDPRGDIDDTIAVVKCQGGEFISTSGDYEKFFEIDGVRYHHIIDPQTGYPVDNNLMSVTIVSDSGIESDILSTACFVMGEKKGMDYVKEKGVEAIFVTKDKKILITPSLKKRFHISDNEYSLK